MNNGENGFKVLRRFPANKEYSVGETVNANEALSIPIRNRIALEKSGYIEFLAEPADKKGFETILKQNEELKAENDALKKQIEELRNGNTSEETETEETPKTAQTHKNKRGAK